MHAYENSVNVRDFGVGGTGGYDPSEILQGQQGTAGYFEPHAPDTYLPPSENNFLSQLTEKFFRGVLGILGGTWGCTPAETQNSPNVSPIPISSPESSSPSSSPTKDDSEIKAKVSKLIADLESDDHLVRVFAMRHLAKLGPAAQEAIPALISILTIDHKSDVEPYEAAVALSWIGAAAIPDLVSLVKNDKWRVRRWGATTLGMMGTEAVPSLISLLKDQNNDVREEAVRALGSMGPDAQAAVPDLIFILQNDADGFVQQDAIIALVEMGPAAQAAIPDLISVLKKDPDSNLAEHAAFAMGKIGAKEAIPDLVCINLSCQPGVFPGPKIDADCDGIPDEREDLNKNCFFDLGETNPYNPDTDGDGLKDGYDPNPLRKDTDGDGISDLEDPCPLDPNPTCGCP